MKQMATAADSKVPEGFLPTAECANLFGLGMKTVNEIGELMDDSSSRKIGGRMYFRAAEMHRFLLDRAIQKDRQRRVGKRQLEFDDAKQKYEANRARKIELEVMEREGALIEVAEIEATIVKTAHVIRKLGSKLARKASVSGRDVQMMINRALEKVQKELDDV